MADRTITVTLEIDAEVEGIDTYIESLESAQDELAELERKANNTDIKLSAQDDASDDIDRVDQAVSRLEMKPDPELEIEARDDASDDIEKVEQNLEELEQLKEPEITIEAVDDASDDLEKVGEGLQKTADKTQQLGEKAEGAKGHFGNLKDEIGGAIAAFGLMEVGQKIVEFFNLGTEVNKAKLEFQNLTKPMGDTAAILDDLRTKTGGAVDDLTLMATSASILKLNLAQTPEQLSMLIDTAFALTGSSEGVENFVSALANASYLRLDTLGISASEVRARVQELTEAGMDMNEAFVTAALEGAEKTLNRLGDAATAAETPVGRLVATLKNVGLQIASGFEQAIQGITGIVEYALGLNPAQQAVEQAEEQAAADAMDLGQEYGGAFVMAAMKAFEDVEFGDQIFSELADASAGTTAFSEALKFMFSEVAKDPSLLADRDKLASTLIWFGGEDVRKGLADAFLDVYNNQVAADMQRAAYQEYQTMSQFQDQIDAAKTSVMDFSPAIKGLRIESDQLFGLYNANRETLKEGISAGIAPGWEDAQESLSEFVDTYDELASAAIPEFLDPKIAEEINRQYEDAVAHLEDMRKLAEEGLISQDQLAQAEQMVDDLAGVRDAADEAAQAFKNLSLSTVFGQDTDANMMKEMLDRVLSDPRLQALGDKKVSSFEDIFNLATGAETAASQLFDQLIIPMLTDAAIQKGPEIAAAMAEAASTALEQATLAGIDTTSADFVQQLADAIAPMASGGTFDAASFVEGLSQANEDISDISIETPDMAADFQAMELAVSGMADKFPLVEQSFAPAQKAAEDLAKTLNELARKPVTVRVNLEIADPSGFFAMMGTSADFAKAVGGATRRTGGSAPGVSNR